MKLIYLDNWSGHLYIQNNEKEYFDLLYDRVKGEYIKYDYTNSSQIIDEINEKAREEIEKNQKILTVLGDHSNSSSFIEKYSNKVGSKNFKLIIFDAHPDVEVCVGEKPTHEDFLRYLIENDYVSPENVTLIGIRTFSRKELDYLLEKGIEFYTMKEFLCDYNKIKSKLEDIKEKIYLSIDIDVLDPTVSPGTYYREWGGMKEEELVDLINLVSEKAEMVDIAEYNKDYDEDNKTLEIVERLVKKFYK